MDKKQLLKHCRYYKGEVDYPGNNFREYYYWQAEMYYVVDYGTDEQQELINKYNNKLALLDTDIPLPLLAEIYREYRHLTGLNFADTMEHFKTNFLSEYLARPLR